LAPVRQIGQLGGRQVELLGQFGRGRADFLGDAAEGGFDRQAGLDADQQQVQRIGEGRGERRLPPLDRVDHQDRRQKEAGQDGCRDDRRLGRHRGVDLVAAEQQQCRDAAERQRRRDPREDEEGDGVGVAPVGLEQLLLHVLTGEQVADLHPVHQIAHPAWTRPPEPGA
jgi:hypothetical protein